MSNAREPALLGKWTAEAVQIVPPLSSPTSPKATKFCCCPNRRRYNLSKQSKLSPTLHVRNIFVDNELQFIDDTAATDNETQHRQHHQQYSILPTQFDNLNHDCSVIIRGYKRTDSWPSTSTSSSSSASTCRKIPSNNLRPKIRERNGIDFGQVASVKDNERKRRINTNENFLKCDDKRQDSEHAVDKDDNSYNDEDDRANDTTTDCKAVILNRKEYNNNENENENGQGKLCDQKTFTNHINNTIHLKNNSVKSVKSSLIPQSIEIIVKTIEPIAKQEPKEKVEETLSTNQIVNEKLEKLNKNEEYEDIVVDQFNRNSGELKTASASGNQTDRNICSKSIEEHLWLEEESELALDSELISDSVLKLDSATNKMTITTMGNVSNSRKPNQHIIAGDNRSVNSQVQDEDILRGENNASGCDITDHGTALLLSQNEVCLQACNNNNYEAETTFPSTSTTTVIRNALIKSPTLTKALKSNEQSTSSSKAIAERTAFFSQPQSAQSADPQLHQQYAGRVSWDCGDKKTLPKNISNSNLLLDTGSLSVKERIAALTSANGGEF